MPDFDNSALTSVPTPDEEDALMFEISGYTLGWRASGLALQRASDRGVEVGEILADLQRLFAADVDEEDLEDLDEEEIEEKLEMQGGMADFMGVVTKLTWLGAIHFEEQIQLDAIRAILDMENAGDLPLDQMLTRIFPAIDDEMGESEGKEQGKPQTQATSPR